MVPTLHDGSIVAVNHAVRGPDELVGKVVALRDAEEDGILIRRVRHPKGYWHFAPDNSGVDADGEPYPVVIVPCDHNADYPAAENPIVGKVDWAWSLFP